MIFYPYFYGYNTFATSGCYYTTDCCGATVELTGRRAAHTESSQGRKKWWVGSWAPMWSWLRDKVCPWASERMLDLAGRYTPSHGPSARSSRHPRSGRPYARTSRHRTHLEGGPKVFQPICLRHRYTQQNAPNWLTSVEREFYSSPRTWALQEQDNCYFLLCIWVFMVKWYYSKTAVTRASVHKLAASLTKDSFSQQPRWWIDNTKKLLNSL